MSEKYVYVSDLPRRRIYFDRKMVATLFMGRHVDGLMKRGVRVEKVEVTEEGGNRIEKVQSRDAINSDTARATLAAVERALPLGKVS